MPSRSAAGGPRAKEYKLIRVRAESRRARKYLHHRANRAHHALQMGRLCKSNAYRFSALLALGLLLPLTAWAHAVLLESTPQDGTVMSGHSVPVLLSFNSRIDQARSTLRLEHPENARTSIAVKKNAEHPSQISGVLPDLTPGSYKLHWQVLAIDGHITQGVISFTVK